MAAALRLALTGLIALLLAAPAGAATCAKVGSTLQVAIAEDDVSVTLWRTEAASGTSGGEIRLTVDGTTSACDTATVRNVDRVEVSGTAQQDWLIVDLANGPLAPGASPEVGTAELELAVTLGDERDVLSIRGSAGPDEFWLGTAGINLNGDADADVTTAGVESHELDGRGADDSLRANGGVSVGAAARRAIVLRGGTGFDVLVGGRGADVLEGGDGDDRLYGGGGDDRLIAHGGNDRANGGNGDDMIKGGSGMDTFTGGPGVDAIDYSGSPRGMTVNLSSSPGSGVGQGRDTLLTIEDVVGSRFADTIEGSSAWNVLTGLGGADTILGRPGDDALFGGRGNDDLYGGLGVDDCDQGAGTGVLNSCED